MDNITATASLDRLNKRHLRAQSFAAEIMRILDDALDRAPTHERTFRRLFLDELIDALVRNGACWTTEEERKALGFDSRDQEGWTISDRIEEKRRMHEAMQMIAAGVPVNID